MTDYGYVKDGHLIHAKGCPVWNRVYEGRDTGPCTCGMDDAYDLGRAEAIRDIREAFRKWNEK